MGRIVLPSSLRSVKYRCRVPIGDDPVTGEPRVCNKPFFDGEHRSYEQHVIRCADDHEEQVRTATVAGKMPGLFGPESGDVELKAWVERNRAALLEGRKRM